MSKSPAWPPGRLPGSAIPTLPAWERLDQPAKQGRPASLPAFLRLPLERRLLDRHQIHGRGLAAPVDLELELQPVALVERDHSGALDRRDVDERVGLTVIARDEAEALGRVEELDRAAGLLAG